MSDSSEAGLPGAWLGVAGILVFIVLAIIGVFLFGLFAGGGPTGTVEASVNNSINPVSDKPRATVTIDSVSGFPLVEVTHKGERVKRVDAENGTEIRIRSIDPGDNIRVYGVGTGGDRTLSKEFVYRCPVDYCPTMVVDDSADDRRPEDYNTLGAAFDNASQQERILVRSGVYDDEIRFKKDGYDITVRGSGLEETTLSGEKFNFVLRGDSTVSFRSITISDAEYALYADQGRLSVQDARFESIEQADFYTASDARARVSDVTLSETATYGIYAAGTGSTYESVTGRSDRGAFGIYVTGSETNVSDSLFDEYERNVYVDGENATVREVTAVNGSKYNYRFDGTPNAVVRSISSDGGRTGIITTEAMTIRRGSITGERGVAVRHEGVNPVLVSNVYWGTDTQENCAPSFARLRGQVEVSNPLCSPPSEQA